MLITTPSIHVTNSFQQLARKKVFSEFHELGGLVVNSDRLVFFGLYSSLQPDML